MAQGPDLYNYFFQMTSGGLPPSETGCPFAPGIDYGNAVSLITKRRVTSKGNERKSREEERQEGESKKISEEKGEFYII